MASQRRAIIDAAAASFSDAEAEFFARVWGGDTEKYEKRLRRIGFANREHVLDCGFGMGQWLEPLARINARVSGLELSTRRVEAVRALTKGFALTNVDLSQGSIEALPYPDAQFDAVFCYGVIFLADTKRALVEIHRVLKPGGTLYCTANGLGWYLYMLVEQHNRGPGYEPRVVAAQAIANAIGTAWGRPVQRDSGIVLPSIAFRRLADEAGFRDVRIGAEGHLAIGPTEAPLSFYDRTEYLGSELVYEALCVR